MHHPFVGFGTYEDLLSSLDRDQVVYLMSTQFQLAGGAHPVGTLQIAVEASAVLADRVLYCRIAIGRVMTHMGRPFGPEELNRLGEYGDRADLARRIMERAASERGIRVDSARVAFPNDLIVSHGWALCLHWDEQTKELRHSTPAEMEQARL